MANLRSYKKKANAKLSKDFNSNEFDCPCNECTTTIIDLDHVAALQKLRDVLNKPIQINSAYRCPSHNKNVGGASNSRHVVGDATDITVAGLTPSQVADICEPMFNGLGRYDTFTHVDSRPLLDKGVKSRWDFRTKK
jgi:uncharacterized protein YcbK (DUF882 family)